MGNPTMWFPSSWDTNRPVQAQKRARSLEFWISVEEELYYPGSENKGADQLRGYREADLRLFSPMQIVGFPMRWLIMLAVTEENRFLGFPSSWDTNLPVQSQKARQLKFGI